MGLLGSVAVAASIASSLTGATSSLTTALLGPHQTPAVQPGTARSSSCRSYGATATCQTTNRYLEAGARLVPGLATSTTVTVTNVAERADGSATLTPGACTTTSTGVVAPSLADAGARLCSSLRVQAYEGDAATGTRFYSGPLSQFTADVALGRATADVSQTYTFVVTVSRAVAGGDRGLAVTQPMTWTFRG